MICYLVNKLVHGLDKTTEQFINTLVDFSLHDKLVSDASFSLFVFFDYLKNFDAAFFDDPVNG